MGPRTYFPDLAAAVDAQLDAGGHELRQCSWLPRAASSANTSRDTSDAFAHGPGIVVDCRQQSRGCSIISIFIIALTVTAALIVRYFGLRLRARHDMQSVNAGVLP